jgi:hypothetical protein
MQKDAMLRMLMLDMKRTRDKYSDESIRHDLQYFIDYVDVMLPKVKDESNV